MKSIFFSITICFIFFSNALQAQTIDNFIGTWKGTSLCQVKNSPCHDEIVVYYIKKGNSPDSCIIKANKIVNGAEEEMGLISFKLDKTNNAIISTDYNSTWTFKLEKQKLKGTLIHNNSLYRIIEVSKVN